VFKSYPLFLPLSDERHFFFILHRYFTLLLDKRTPVSYIRPMLGSYTHYGVYFLTLSAHYLPYFLIKDGLFTEPFPE